MSINEVGAKALKLDPKACARWPASCWRGSKILSEEENAKLWAEEGETERCRDGREPDSGTSAADAFREARAKLK